MDRIHGPEGNVAVIFVLVPLVFPACGVGTDTYNATLRDLERVKVTLARTERECSVGRQTLEEELDRCEAQKREVRGQLEALGQNVSRLEEERGALTSSLEAIKGRMAGVERAEGRTRARARLVQELRTALHPAIERGEMEVAATEEWAVVVLRSRALFSGGGTTFRPSGRALLAEVAGALKAVPDTDFLVTGHALLPPRSNATVRKGHARDPWRASAARALAVVRFLERQGIAPERLGVAGLGPFRHPGEGRVEILLLPSQGGEAAPATPEGGSSGMAAPGSPP